ncbi:MAG: hypothetical protein K5757_08145 [Bacteroidaceae bacterium]|nr:hypothetical protein [Bacteroidaceae bacterium]
MKHWLYIIALFCIFETASAQYINMPFPEHRHSYIYQEAKKKYGKRIEDIHWNYIDSLQYNKDNDTIFIMQEAGILGEFDFIIWNSKMFLFYGFENKTFVRVDRTGLSKYAIQLVNDWNIDKIKEEDAKGARFIPSYSIDALRIILKDGTCTVDYIDFVDFDNDENRDIDYFEISLDYIYSQTRD